MSPRVPRLRWDDPFRALDMLASLWSSTGMSLVSAGAAQAVAAPYRTLFTTLQQLLIGKEVTVRIGDHDVVLTVTELDSALEPQELVAGRRGLGGGRYQRRAASDTGPGIGATRADSGGFDRGGQPLPGGDQRSSTVP